MEKFAKMLEELAGLKDQGRWPEIQIIVGHWFEYLLGKDLDKYLKRSDTILLEGLLSHSTTYAVPSRKVMLIRLLAEAGDIGRAVFPPQGGCGWYLSALDLLSFSLGRQELPEEYLSLLPSLESLLVALGDVPLPAKTLILVMAECERRGRFGRMLDQYRAALRRRSKSPKLLAFGIGVFTRLSYRDDAELEAGGLSRSGLLALMTELAVLSAECSGFQVQYSEGVDKKWN